MTGCQNKGLQNRDVHINVRCAFTVTLGECCVELGVDHSMQGNLEVCAQSWKALQEVARTDEGSSNSSALWLAEPAF